MFDLLIRGERVVTPHGVGPWEIGVKDGVIAALGAPGVLAAHAARVIDAGWLHDLIEVLDDEVKACSIS